MRKLPIVILSLVIVFTCLFAVGVGAQEVTVFDEDFSTQPTDWSSGSVQANYDPHPTFELWNWRFQSMRTNVVVEADQVPASGGSVCTTLRSPAVDLTGLAGGRVALNLLSAVFRRNRNDLAIAPFDGWAEPFSYAVVSVHGTDGHVLWERRLFEHLTDTWMGRLVFDLPGSVIGAGEVSFGFKACAGVGAFVPIIEEPHAELSWSLLEVSVTGAAAPVLRLDASEYEVTEGEPLTITVTRSGDPRDETWAWIRSGPAGDVPAAGCWDPTWSCDYLNLSSPDLTGIVKVVWPDGVVGPRTIQLQTLQDDRAEGPETLHVYIGNWHNPLGVTPIEPNDAMVTIVDDDPMPDTVPDGAHQPLDFGTVNIGEPVVRRIEVTNTGYGVFEVVGASVDYEMYGGFFFPPEAFSLDPSGCQEARLGHEVYCGMDVTFTPTRVGPVEAGVWIATTVGGERGPDLFVRLTAVGADTVPPATTAMVSPAPNAAGWNHTETTVALDATDGDGGSGVKEIVYTLSGAQTGGETVAGDSVSIPILAEGATTVTYLARDVAGNEEPAQSVTVRLDTTPPVVSCEAAPPPNAHGWNNTPVTVGFTASDALSGVDDPPGSQVVTGEGANQVVERTVADRAGNTASAACSVSLDRTPPSIAGTRVPEANAAGWNNTDVAVTFTCSDGLSGMDTCGPTPQIVSAEGAGQWVTGEATDLAGNIASAIVDGINIDKTPPAVACGAAPGVLWPANHKMVPVRLSVTVDDPMSGPGEILLTSATSSEPDNGLGDGDTPADIQEFALMTSDTAGLLRAERSGRGPGRLYRFTYTGADGAGNPATCEVIVTVPHSRRK